ncbi:MAG: alpha/beta hydrolase [Lachnospiraceae bacterium]|nr:alpha/beta hydrolase [Lachnospiraceae bacterium]
MKKIIPKLLKITKVLLLTLLSLLLIFLIIRFIGKALNNRTPKGGINESMYVEINGTQQWISIYGEDINNPVLLYLHGGPGSSTSAYDYAFTRQWADVYTVVTWDQRNCGKSYEKSQNDTALTYELMMSDGLEMTKFLIDYLDKEKITILGHSWGTYYGCNLVLAYPQYYDCYIGTGQLVDMYQNEVAFKEIAREWVGDDEEGLELLASITPGHYTEEYFRARNLLMQKYGYDMLRDGTDYNVLAAEIFNPYYSLPDWVKLLNSDASVYTDFLMSDEFNKFSLLGKTEYEVPYYNINGDCDYQTNYVQAQEYFDEIDTPYKRLYMMEDTTHGLLESKSEAFSEILHEIAKEQER